jgi:hypothetical protein
MTLIPLQNAPHQPKLAKVFLYNCLQISLDVDNHISSGEGNSKTVKKQVKKISKVLLAKVQPILFIFLAFSHIFQEIDLQLIVRTGLRSQKNKRLMAGL